MKNIYLSKGLFIKEHDSASTSSHELPVALMEEWDFMSPFSLHSGMLMDPVLFRSSAGSYPWLVCVHECRKTCHVPKSAFQRTSFHALALAFFTVSLWGSLKFRRDYIDSSHWAWHSTVAYSGNFWQEMNIISFLLYG